jgi:molybdopterin molybdotransferase
MGKDEGQLLNVDSAIEQILAQIQPMPLETVHLTAALGRVLAEDMVSEVDLPPFANSSMDGYALRAADSVTAPIKLRVAMDIPAGVFPTQTLQAGEAARIMTGAPIPNGADAVIRVEDTDSQWGLGDTAPEWVEIRKPIKAGDSIRPIGENIQRGQTILKAGTVLRSQDIGVLASIGRAVIPVARQPRVVILTTGDELVTADEPLTLGKIRDANSYTLAGLVTEHGGLPTILPIARDTLEAVQALFRDALGQQPDMVISSAGMSVGAADFVKTVLDEMGRVNFWRVNIRPGKPLAFGLLRDIARPSEIPFFGLPGNPVSAMVTFDVAVRPALAKMLGQSDDLETVTAVVDEAFTSDGRRSYLRVTLHRENGRLIARQTGTQSSAALMSMVLADGLLIVPEGLREIKAGMEFTVRRLR